MKGFSAATGRGVKFIDRSGTRFGRLLFTKTVGIDAHSKYIWEAVCDCGSTARTSQPAKTKSCGCLHREVSAERQRKKALPPEVKAASRKASAAKQRSRRKADPAAVMQARLSRLHRHALARFGAIKTCKTFDHFGYSVEQFVAHIERQFLPGMGWHNMSNWQIDHIVPASSAKTEADVVALNQLSNLRPMWAAENNAKKNKRVTLL